MPFAAIRDLDVYYELHGDGPPLLMISGSGNDLRASQPEATPLNQHFTVAHYDQRGLGQTSKPDVDDTMADYADDAAALLDHLGWPTARVMGISFGGMVAQNLAVRHGDRIDKLVLACTSSGGSGGSSADLLALAPLPAAQRGDASLSLVDTRYVPGSAQLPAGLERYGEFVANRPNPDPSSEAGIGARRQLEARAGHDVFDALPGVTADTLVIGGRYDGIAPPSNLERIAGQMPNATLEMCDGGHMFLLQDPSAWATISAFLQS